jgi:hypothetical protein
MMRYANPNLIGVLAGVLACALQSKAEASECTSTPEKSVYDIVDTQTGSRHGTATLLDSRNAIFITALHLLGSSNLALSRDGETFKFDAIAAGRAPDKLFDDWALLQAVKDGQPMKLLPRPDLHITYDAQGGEVLNKATVLTSSSSTASVSATRWSKALNPGNECNLESVTLTKIEKYDKGNSGSALFSRDSCGIVAISSRFELPEDASLPDAKEAVSLFYKYQDAFKSYEYPPVGENVSLEDRVPIVRTWLKNELFVKVVPAQCIINGLIDISVREKGKQVERVAMDRNSSVNDVVSILETTDMNSYDGFEQIKQQLILSTLNWSSLLFLWDDWYNGVLSKKIKQGKYTSFVREMISARSRQMSYDMVSFPFIRALTALGQDKSPLFSVATGGFFDQPVITYSDAAKAFVEQNKDWSAESTGRYNGLKPLMPNDLGGGGPTTLIDLGEQMGRSASEPIVAESLTSEQALAAAQIKQVLQDASIVYLSAGLALAAQGEKVEGDEKRVPNLYAVLAQTVQDRFGQQKTNSKFASELAKYSLEEGGGDPRSNAIAKQVLTKFDASQTIPDLNKYDLKTFDQKTLQWNPPDLDSTPYILQDTLKIFPPDGKPFQLDNKSLTTIPNVGKEYRQEIFKSDDNFKLNEGSLNKFKQFDLQK